MNPQNLANVIWAYGHCKIADYSLTSSILNAARVLGDEPSSSPFKIQEISNMLYGVAKCHQVEVRENEELQKKISRLLFPVIQLAKLQRGSASTSEMAQIALSLGWLNLKDTELLDHVARNLELRMDHFSDQGLANCLWGLSKLNVPFPFPLTTVINKVLYSASLFFLSVEA